MHISIFDDLCTVGNLRSRAFQRCKDYRKWIYASNIMDPFCQGQFWFGLLLFRLGLVVGWDLIIGDFGSCLPDFGTLLPDFRRFLLDFGRQLPHFGKNKMEIRCVSQQNVGSIDLCESSSKTSLSPKSDFSSWINGVPKLRQLSAGVLPKRGRFFPARTLVLGSRWSSCTPQNAGALYLYLM